METQEVIIRKAGLDASIITLHRTGAHVVIIKTKLLFVNTKRLVQLWTRNQYGNTLEIYF